MIPVVEPLAVIFVSSRFGFDTISLLLTFKECTCVGVAIRFNFDSLSMLLTFRECTCVGVFISKRHLALAIVFVLVPLTVILVSILFDFDTFSVPLLLNVVVTIVSVFISKSNLALAKVLAVNLVALPCFAVGFHFNRIALLFTFNPITHADVSIRISNLALTVFLVVEVAALILGVIVINEHKEPIFPFIIKRTFVSFFSLSIGISIFSFFTIVIEPFPLILVTIRHN